MPAGSDAQGGFERWNTHLETSVEQTVFDVPLCLFQDPSSYNHGTTVWDASIVLAKWLEQNSKKGELSRVKVRGRRAVELGAGMGLGGIALAILGANVILTDITDPVLSLLKRNVETNLSPAALRLKDAAWVLDVTGTAIVQELDWGKPEHFAAVKPPVEVVIAADCVYSELAVPNFLQAVLALCNQRTIVAIANEFRCARVHELFMKLFGEHFTMKKVPANKMNKDFQHPLIHIYILKKRKVATGETTGVAEGNGGGDEGEGEGVVVTCDDGSGGVTEASGGVVSSAGRVDAAAAAAGGTTGGSAENGAAVDEGTAGNNDADIETAAAVEKFQTRRQGAVLAKMLKDVKLDSEGAGATSG